jgi:hypothetical protein
MARLAGGQHAAILTLYLRPAHAAAGAWSAVPLRVVGAAAGVVAGKGEAGKGQGKAKAE